MEKFSSGILLFLGIFVGINSYASQPQRDSTRLWNLEDVVEYAISNNVNVQTQILDVENKEIAVKTSQLSRLPNLYGSIGENLNFGRSQTRYGVTEDQSAHNTSASLSSSIPVFQGLKILNQVKSDKHSLEASRLDLEQSKQDLSLSVTAFYLQVLYSREALNIAREQLSINENLVALTRKMVDGGTQTVSELYNSESSLAISQSSCVEAENDCKSAVLDLVQAINYPDYHGFEIEAPEEDLVDEAILRLTPAEDIYESYLSKRPGVLASMEKVKKAQFDVKVSQSMFWPSIYLGVSYGSNYYGNFKNNGGNQDFFTQLGNNGQAVVGASISIPIFNRMSTANSVRTAKNNVRTQELSLRQSRLDAIKDVQTAYVNASTALAKYQSGIKSEEASRKAFEFEQKKYEAGRSTAYQFDEMRQKHAKAALELLQAKYSLIFRVKILEFYKGNPLY